MGNSGSGEAFIAQRDDRFLKERREEIFEEYGDLEKSEIEAILQEELLLAAKADTALAPVKCGLLVVGLDGTQCWIQGSLTFDVTFVDFQADLPVFNHLLKERYSYHDVIEIRKFQKTMLMITAEYGRKKTKIELLFDLQSKATRTEYFGASRKLWSRVGRNTDLVIDEHERLHQAGILGPYQDPVEVFYKARRLETQQRNREHLVSYRDWQKLMNGLQVHVYNPGDVVLKPGESIDKVYCVAQGGLRVLDTTSNLKQVEEQKEYAEHKARAEDEVMDWVQESLIRNREAELEAAEWGEIKDGLPSPYSSSESSHSEDEEDDDYFEEKEDSATGGKQLNNLEQGGLTLGMLRKDDVFGVVPFLLHYDPSAKNPKSTLKFEVTEPFTLVYSFDAKYLKESILGSKKDVTAAWFKYLAVILGERIEIAEDAMFSRHLEDYSQNIVRRQEELLEKKRLEQEEAGFVDISEGQALSIQEIFGFDVTENLLDEYKGDFYTHQLKSGVQHDLRLGGIFYITDHYLAFAGVAKTISLGKKPHKVVIPYDEIVFLRLEGKKAVLVTDQSLSKKLIVLKSTKVRDAMMEVLEKKWRQEDMEKPAQARALLRRRITLLNNQKLEIVEKSIKDTARAVVAEMSEKDKKMMFMGTVPIAMQRNQLVIQEGLANSTLYLLQSGTVRIQRLREHAGGTIGSGRTVEKVVFHEINPGEIFGFDSFLTGEPSSSYIVDSEKAIIRCCTKQQILDKLGEDKRLASKFYRVAAVSLALRLAEISPLDVFF